MLWYIWEMATHSFTVNSSPSKKKCLSYIDMTSQIKLMGCALCLTRVSSFHVRYLLLHFINSLKTEEELPSFKAQNKDSHL